MHRISAGRRIARMGFTLVELLIVMAILGILAGLLAWGVNAARISILKSAQAFEIQSIAASVEAYRNKYGDYPPDGSSWPVMEAHLRKAFPNILVTELALLNPAFSFPGIPAGNYPIRNDNDITGSHPHLGRYRADNRNDSLRSGRVFDSAEALVFFLGGFSSDPQRPITGPGGPLKAVTGGYIYNTQRENAFFEFPLSKLTLDPNSGFSTDETIYGEGVPPDLMPVYVSSGPSISQGGVPVVYFDSRTYQLAGSTVGDASYYFNFYSPGLVFNQSAMNQCTRNCLRPFLSMDLDPTKTNALRYANDKTFQIHGAGFDRVYGCQSVRNVAPQGDNKPAFLFTVPGGNTAPLNPQTLTFPKPGVSSVRFFNPEFWIDTPNAPMNRHLYVNDNTSNIIDAPTFADSN